MQCLPSGRGTTVVTSDHDGVAIAAGDAAAVVAAAELNPEAKEPELQCLPSGRGTTVVTDDHDGVAIAAGDAAAVVAAAELDPEAKEPELQRLPSGRGTTVVAPAAPGPRDEVPHSHVAAALPPPRLDMRSDERAAGSGLGSVAGQRLPPVVDATPS